MLLRRRRSSLPRGRSKCVNNTSGARPAKHGSCLFYGTVTKTVCQNGVSFAANAAAVKASVGRHRVSSLLGINQPQGRSNLPKKEILAEGVEIWLGDCREVLAYLDKVNVKVDVTVTSPPYNTLTDKTMPGGMHNGNSWLVKSANGYFDSRPEQEYQTWIVEIFSMCSVITRGLLWLNHKIRYRDKTGIHPVRLFPWPLYCEVIWDRGVSMALNAKKFSPSHEGMWAFGKPHYWNDKNNSLMSVWRIAPQIDDEHPCPFPIKLVRPIIESSCPPDGIILDPFMGSGTTGVAAVKLGRRFIGIEIEPKYYKIAKRRITEALRQPDLFIEKPKPAKQESFL